MSSGIYAILTDATVEGLVWILLTVALSAVLLRGRGVAEHGNRRIPAILWLFMALLGTLVGGTEFHWLLTTDVQQLGSILIPELFRDLATVVDLALLGIFLWQLTKSYRQSKQA